MSVSSTGYNPSGCRSRQNRQDNRHYKCAYIFIHHFEPRLMPVFYDKPTMRPVESNPTATLTMELTGAARKADRGVRGTVVRSSRDGGGNRPTGPFVSSHHRPWISTMTVGVRGTLTKFKRRRGVAKSVNVPRFKIGQNLSIPTSPCQVSPPAGQINVIVHA